MMEEIKTLDEGGEKRWAEVRWKEEWGNSKF